jgi:hypothetical protein
LPIAQDDLGGLTLVHLPGFPAVTRAPDSIAQLPNSGLEHCPDSRIVVDHKHFERHFFGHWTNPPP